MKYKNYGDIGFLDYGRLVATDKLGINVICCDPDCETGGYDIHTCYVWFVDIDINNNDSWIDHKTVMEFADINSIETMEDKIQFALACIDYYGFIEFSGDSWHQLVNADSTEILDYISDLDIEW